MSAYEYWAIPGMASDLWAIDRDNDRAHALDADTDMGDLSLKEFFDDFFNGTNFPKARPARLCPRDGRPLHPVRARNALSRVDNKTYICNSCGDKEAMWDWNNQGRHDEMPPLTESL